MSETNVVRVVLYRDTADEWRWRAEAGNGEIVAEGEGHTRPEDAARAARGVLHGVPLYRETTTPDGNGVTIEPEEEESDGPA